MPKNSRERSAMLEVDARKDLEEKMIQSFNKTRAAIEELKEESVSADNIKKVEELIEKHNSFINGKYRNFLLAKIGKEELDESIFSIFLISEKEINDIKNLKRIAS